MTLTITITDPRIVDGWVEAANRNGTTPEKIATEFLRDQGCSYADLFKVGIITSSAFIRRSTFEEYGAILGASSESPEIEALVNELIAAPNVSLDNPHLESGLQLLADSGLIEQDRVAELLTYERPVPDQE